MTKAKLIQENKAQKEQINDLRYQLEQQKFIVEKLQKMLFGARSEKQTKPADFSPDQLQLFTPPERPSEEELTLKQTITYEREKAKPKKNANTRVPLPENLPRIPILLEPEEDTTGMIKIGEEITEILDIIPPQFRVLQLIRPKYAHPQAATQDLEKPILVAPMPSRVIDKGIPSTRLLAYILICKFMQHLPYYRQIQSFQLIGVQIKSNTLNGWIARTCTLLKPLYDAFCKHIFSKSYLQADETTIKVLKTAKKGQSNKKGKAKLGYFWVYYDPTDNQVVFIFNPGRARVYPAQDMKDFKGTLQTDGLRVYDAFDLLDYITLVSCMAHIRRKFVDARSNDPDRANHVLTLIAQLYAIEKTAREDNYTSEQRKKIRQEKAKPIMDTIKSYLDKQYQSGKIRPKSAIGQAIRYALNRWSYQERYLDDGTVEIDNNLVENSIRPIAIGRKNYLFAGSTQGAQWAAIIYTLLGSALRQGLQPFDYLTDVLRRLPDNKISQIQQLFPHNWSAKDNSDHLLI